MRLKKYLVDGLVGYQGDPRARNDYADSESAAMKKEREKQEKKKINDPNVTGDDLIKRYERLQPHQIGVEIQNVKERIKRAEDKLDKNEYSGDKEADELFKSIDKNNEKLVALKAVRSKKKRG